MADHVSNECPDWDVDSEYHYAGCVIKEPKQQLEQYIKDSVSLHLSLVSDHMLNNFSLKEKEVCKFKYELSQDKKAVDNFLKQSLSKEKEICELRNELKENKSVIDNLKKC